MQKSLSYFFICNQSLFYPSFYQWNVSHLQYYYSPRPSCESRPSLQLERGKIITDDLYWFVKILFCFQSEYDHKLRWFTKTPLATSRDGKDHRR